MPLLHTVRVSPASFLLVGGYLQYNTHARKSVQLGLAQSVLDEKRRHLACTPAPHLPGHPLLGSLRPVSDTVAQLACLPFASVESQGTRSMGLRLSLGRSFVRFVHVGACGCICPFSLLYRIPPYESPHSFALSTLDGHLTGFQFGPL